MPAPRAILIDIMKLGLDPKKPHASLNKHGRLSQKDKKDSITKKTKEVVSKVEIQEKKEVKLSTSLPLQEEKKTVEATNTKVEVKIEDNQKQEETRKETFQVQEEVKVELSPVQEKVVESQSSNLTETKLEEVVEEKQTTFQSLSQQDRFLKKKNALKKM